MSKLIEAGKNPENPEDAELFQQQLSPENLKTLPEIEKYYQKNYRSMIAEWASHQHIEDTYRFHLTELEERNFKNSLITDSAYFHFPMFENDYGIEIWNPMFTFVFKAPESRFTSQAHSVGNIQLMTIPDVLDKFGNIMTADQQESLELIYPATNAVYNISGLDPQSSYDASKSHEWNVDGPSLGMRQVTSMVDNVGGSDILSILMNQNDFPISGQHYLVRVTTVYWKSQRKVGHLTRIKENGEVEVDIVDETYKITDKPIYNNTLIRNKTADTLIFGEHIEWTWINHSWGGVKIGPNVPSYSGMPATTAVSGLQPIYLGINQNEPGPLRYQFKGDDDLYGCKLPVEGATFSDYNTRSVSPVDLLKPWQIAFNVVNNQIQDILMDELGVIVALESNQLPQESLGEDWGKGNYAKAWVAMKDFNILPLDRRLANTEGAGGAQPLQQLYLSQTQRLLSRIQLATYFKNEGLGLFGVTPQRTGQPTSRQTATGVEQSMTGAFAQTEPYFTRFSDYLMPRVHQMRTDLAQYYVSTNPSKRLQYMTSKEEQVNFQINGTSLLSRTFNVYGVTDANSRKVMEELRNLLITNNTAGGTIYELGNLLTANSLGEINTILKGIEQKSDAKRQEEQQHEMEVEKQRQEAVAKDKQVSEDFQMRALELKLQNDVLVAEIRAAGYSGSVDLNANQQNDFLDNLKIIQGQKEFQDTMNMEQQKEANRNQLAKDKATIEREKMNTQLKSKQYDLAVARANKNQFDVEKKRKEKEKKNKK